MDVHFLFLQILTSVLKNDMNQLICLRMLYIKVVQPAASKGVCRVRFVTVPIWGATQIETAIRRKCSQTQVTQTPLKPSLDLVENKLILPPSGWLEYDICNMCLLCV